MARSALSLAVVLVATTAVSGLAVHCERLPPQPQVTPLPEPRQDAPAQPAAFWELPVENGFLVNRGAARVERVGNRWALSVMCSGTHTTYLDDTTLDLPRYAKGYVRARYRYVVRDVPNPRCVQAPCGPVTERRIALEELTVDPISADEANARANACRSPESE